ncbi:hypothetical protein P8452_14242 [Trifolium repens]|jgi:hypothetical protein|nr:hypothetical protein QL285_009631 [Trifolium repens]WJX25177.1 hypothetical protein P8452_14242 [Trifolium repens]
MARKSSRKNTVAELRTQRGKKKLEGSTSRSKRTSDPKEVKLKNPPFPQDSSSSDDIDGDYAEFLKTYNPQEFYPSGVLPQDSSSSDDVDEDYAEFLKTYNPQEFYPSGYTSEEDGGSQVTVESKVKTTKSSGLKPSK